MDSQLLGGSICITDLMDKLKAGHSAFSKSAKNNKVYCNILVWVNPEKDEFGNNASLQLSSTKEFRESEGKIYIGNAKFIQTTKPISEKDTPKDDWDLNVPVRELKSTETDGGDKVEEKDPKDDLPF